MSWERVYDKEMARRRRIALSNSKLFKQIYLTNPKGIIPEHKCKEHIWVPATHLMIHDNGARSTKIGGLTTRAFIEAKPYSLEEVTVVPQICWHCHAAREIQLAKTSAVERKAQYAEINKTLRKRRKSKVQPIQPLGLF